MECYRLLTTAVVGFEAIGPGPMLNHGRLSTTSSERYGALTWPLLYQCDVRCKLDHMERLRRVLERKFLDATARGQAPSVSRDSTTRPWDSVWTAACEDFGCWHCQFEELALVILRHHHGRSAGGDTRVHRGSNGIFTHNRRGVALCPDFQSVSCPTGRGNTCGTRILRTSVTSVSQNVKGGSVCKLSPKEPVARGAGKGKDKKKGKRQS